VLIKKYSESGQKALNKLFWTIGLGQFEIFVALGSYSCLRVWLGFTTWLYSQVGLYSRVDLSNFEEVSCWLVVSLCYTTLDPKTKCFHQTRLLFTGISLTILKSEVFYGFTHGRLF
jgi:hypothetical protein